MKYLVTEEDMKRYDIFKQVSKKELKLIEASILLGISYRHTKRLFKKFTYSGLDGLIKKYNNKNKNLKITELLEKKLLNWRKEIYPDFNILHFKDKLEEIHDVKLSYETLRQFLIKHDDHKVKKRKKVYRRRRRMPKAGMLIQMDSSQHQWIESIPEKWWLISGIDDATNEIPDASFEPSDTTFANMNEIRAIIEKKGIFDGLYVDKASHFKTTRHKGLHQDVNEEQQESNIAKALNELNITLILANSPQAKGRIERSFGFFQDRLIKEMRLAGINNYKDANKFLKEKFLPWYNKKYTHKAESVYKDIPKEMNLDVIFTIREDRKVNKDNTICFYNQIIQLPRNNITMFYKKPRVEIRVSEKQIAYILYKNKIIKEEKLEKPIRETELKKREKMLSKKIAI